MTDCLSNIEGCDKSNFVVCETTFPPSYHFKLANIKNPREKEIFHAAFLCRKLWEKGTEISYGFLPQSVPCSVAYSLPNQIAPAGKTLIPVLNESVSDPLALEFSKKWVDAPDEITRLGVQKDAVKAVLERFSRLMTLKFKHTKDVNNADLKILFTTDQRSFAFVGTDNLYSKAPEGQNVNLGWFDIGTIIHEIGGHCLGMVHEHQNPIGGISIDWDREKVYRYFSCSQGWTDQMIDNNILNPIDETTVNGSCFDPLSVMLYQYPSCLTKNGVGTKFNQRLSALDTLWLSNLYGGENIHDTPSGVYRSLTMSAEEWYDKVYGEGEFQKSLTLSTELRKKYSNGKDCDYNIPKDPCGRPIGTQPKPTDPKKPKRPTDPKKPKRPDGPQSSSGYSPNLILFLLLSITYIAITLLKVKKIV